MPSALRRHRRAPSSTAYERLGSALGAGRAAPRTESSFAVDEEDEDDDDASRGGAVRTLGDVLPPAVRGGRLRLEPRALAVLAVVAVAAVVLAGWYAWQARAAPGVQPPAVRAAGTAVAASPVPAGETAVPSTAPSELVVDVAGRVRHPGLVRLPPGSRVADALAAAGGVLPGVDLSTLNLARLVADGEQVLVAVPGATAVGTSGASTATGAAGDVVDLNTATVEQLDTLPDVGPVLAQRIVDWRTAHGRFASVDQLGEVGGIGPKKLSDIRPHVRV